MVELATPQQIQLLGTSCLIAACEMNDLEAAKKLLSFGINVNIPHEDKYPIHTAIDKGSCEMVSLLLDFKAELTSVEKAVDVYEHAVKNNQIYVLRVLLARTKPPLSISTYSAKAINPYMKEALNGSWKQYDADQLELLKAVKGFNVKLC
jgi:ankyrin repeat protein